jgi:SAM-dependent methyltransferase
MRDPDLVREQVEFYRRRAPRYDEWWQRAGPYDHGPDEAREWAAQVGEVERALASFGPSGDVLELAGGTGWWTQRLAPGAGKLTVVDASAETLELNRFRVGRADVDYRVADLFSWRPDESGSFDVVFFSFWLSHVPRPLFEQFWDLVRLCLRPAGRVFFIDNRWDPTRDRPDPYVVGTETDVQVRTLSDGSTHRVVKIFYEPAELEDRLRPLGWTAEVSATRWLIYGRATRAA